jgi:hypothetical protein
MHGMGTAFLLAGRAMLISTGGRVGQGVQTGHLHSSSVATPTSVFQSASNNPEVCSWQSLEIKTPWHPIYFLVRPRR